MSKRRTTDEKDRSLSKRSEAAREITEILRKYSIDEPTLNSWIEEYGSNSSTDLRLRELQEENRTLKRMVADLVMEMRAPSQECSANTETQPLSAGVSQAQEQRMPGHVETGQKPALSQASSAESGQHDPNDSSNFAVKQSFERCATYPRIRESVQSLLDRSRIIPAIRSLDYMAAAIASPATIMWLLFGTPLSIGDVVRELRFAGKLPVANLDLITGFAQDADGVELLVELGIAGVVSTRQSVLRAARAQGIIAVQRTFLVDSIAVGNITRSLHHFTPDVIELLPAVAAPLAVPAIHAALPHLPIIATGLVTSMRQVEELGRNGVSSVATSDSSLWIL